VNKDAAKINKSSRNVNGDKAQGYAYEGLNIFRVGRNSFKWVNKRNTRDEILFHIQQEDAKKEIVLRNN
jgi:hypothetical protein